MSSFGVKHGWVIDGDEGEPIGVVDCGFLGMFVKLNLPSETHLVAA